MTVAVAKIRSPRGFVAALRSTGLLGTGLLGAVLLVATALLGLSFSLILAESRQFTAPTVADARLTGNVRTDALSPDAADDGDDPSSFLEESPSELAALGSASVALAGLMLLQATNVGLVSQQLIEGTFVRPPCARGPPTV